MIHNQVFLEIHDESIVDNFAGGGGASTGIEQALNRAIDAAINHDAEALAMHAANHPHTRHYCEDVFKVDPVEVTKGKPVGFAWFSPDCKHFSKAKGGKPREKKIRGLAWVMVKWADSPVAPRVMVLENVEEFQHWGPLLPDGTPCARRKGWTFKSFKKRLASLGYQVEHRELRACDYGAPTIRKRFFLIARRDGRPIVWPEPTHGKPGSEGVMSGALLPWRTAAECIDWSIPCPSIFERKRPLADATLCRIARGIRKFVIETPTPFIVKVNHVGCQHFRGQSIDQPLQTITAKHGYGIAVPFVQHVQHASAVTGCMPVNGPLRTITATPKGGSMAIVTPILVGAGGPAYSGKPTPVNQPMGTLVAENHKALVAATLVQTGYGEREGQEPRAPGLDKPLGTVVAGGVKHAAVATFLSKMYGTTTGQRLDEPIHTITGQGNHFAAVRAFLIKYYGEGGQDQDIGAPLHTITTKDRLGLITVAGEDYVITDIGMRMLEPHELYKAQGFPDGYVIAFKRIGRPLPKHAQVRMCGNSVPPPFAKAICEANVPEMIVKGKNA